MKDPIYQKINNGIPVTYFAREFNGGQYSIGLTIFDMYGDQACQLSSSTCFQSLIIGNSIQWRCPSFQLTFIDIGGYYSRKVSHNKEYIFISILEPPGDKKDEEKKIQMNLVCSIQSHQLLSVDSHQAKYRIKGALWISRNFGMHVNYSTGVQTFKEDQSKALSPYQIIANVLRMVNIPLNKRSEDDDLFPPTTQRIHYITDQNQTVNDLVDYCLELGCSQTSKPTYLHYHIIQHTMSFFNTSFIKRDCDFKVVKDLHVLVGMRVNEAGFKRQSQIKSISVKTNASALESSQSRGLHIQWHYDAIERKWTQNVFTPRAIDKLVTFKTQVVKEARTALRDQDYKESQIRTYRCNWQKDIYRRLKNLDLHTLNVQIVVEGSIYRQVGQYLQINCSNGNYASLLGGGWLTYSILHIFAGNTYQNKIVGCRTVDLNTVGEGES